MTGEGYVRWETENIIKKAFVAGVRYATKVLKDSNEKDISVKKAVDEYITSYWEEEKEE